MCFILCIPVVFIVRELLGLSLVTQDFYRVRCIHVHTVDLVLLQDWQPPFAVDVDNFTFTPRVQRLNELEVSCINETWLDFSVCFRDL